ncbi:molybdopterin molybdotransferase MoeA [Planctomycetales bacterium ZRK34]|nr:molybdopterin molybdotransferase MoeA [Planctomycetales bacterium ZRK34]
MNSCSTSSKPFAFDDPSSALAAMIDRLQAVDAEHVPLADACGRVLAEPVVTDRPSPACDVSAMDGYAVRRDELADDMTLPVCGEVATGQAPPELAAGHAVRIFTGGAVPAQADVVIRREDVEETAEVIRLRVPVVKIQPGANIRRCGENAPAGTRIAEPGTCITSPVAGAMASFGYVQAPVRRRVRVTILTTGNEVLGAESKPQPWQLRDSNGPSLWAMLNTLPWVDAQQPKHIADDPQTMAAAFGEALDCSDAVIATGGVSVGDHDHVPSVVRQAGCDVIFHGLPIRPGKPILGAIGPKGQVVFGLPGNPVSVMITARRMVIPVLRRIAGCRMAEDHPVLVRITNPDSRVLKMHWWRPARRTGADTVELIRSQGSGDVVSTAASDGFVELPPEASGPGPWAFYPWSTNP